MTSVLVVDDLAIYRGVIARSIAATPGLEVVGQVGSGSAALEAIAALRPDLMTLDLEMPGMDGLAVLDAMNRLPPSIKRPTVVVFSAHSADGAGVTLQALNLGAADFVLKPTSADGLTAIDERLVPRLKELAQQGRRVPPPPAAPRPLDRTARRRVIAIASSTGGPPALAAALAPLPGPPPVPLLIVQHMPPVFTRVMAEHLSKLCRFPIVEAQQDMTVEPGTAYVAPGDWHMTVSGTAEPKIVLHQGERLTGLRPAADILFASLAETFGGGVLGAVFTGMGRDGTDGAMALRRRGGVVLNQTRDSCVVYGMPQAIDEAGCADAHFSPADFWSLAGTFNLRWR